MNTVGDRIRWAMQDKDRALVKRVQVASDCVRVFGFVRHELDVSLDYVHRGNARADWRKGWRAR